MTKALPRISALLIACSWLSVSFVAAGAPCGRPDVDLTFPPNQAQNVPPNATFAAHYAAPALYNSEPVNVTDADGNAVAVTTSFDEADALLRVTPDQALASGQLQIEWPKLRGVGSGGLGRGSTVSISVGSVADASPPSFAGLSDIDWNLSRERDPCLDKLEDRFVFTLKVGAASDDLDTSLLSLLIFATRDPTTHTEPIQLAVRAFPESSSVEVRRPATKGGDTCFAAIAQDLLGNLSGGGEHEVCIKTRKPPFFEGCALAPTAPGALTAASGAAFVLGLLGLLFLRRGRIAGRPFRAV